MLQSPANVTKKKGSNVANCSETSHELEIEKALNLRRI